MNRLCSFSSTLITSVQMANVSMEYGHTHTHTRTHTRTLELECLWQTELI